MSAQRFRFPAPANADRVVLRAGHTAEYVLASEFEHEVAAWKLASEQDLAHAIELGYKADALEAALDIAGEKIDALLSALRRIHHECDQVYDGATTNYANATLAEIMQITGPLVGEKT